MRELHFAVFGAGFWANFQLGAWTELAGARCVAVYNRTLSRARELAARYGVPAAYDDPEALLSQEKLDFVDVITHPATHPALVRLVAGRRIPVICQKPMAESLEESKDMVRFCREAGTPFYIHENWRWQDGIRRLKAALVSGVVGAPFRARIDHTSDYPVFSKEPGLKDWKRYILADVGVHLLDTARFLFGEARRLYCQTSKVHEDLKGEDVATVMLSTESGATVTVYMGFPENHVERDIFPETRVFVEARKGSIELATDYWLRVTTAEGTHVTRKLPRSYPWGEPDYIPFCSAIVPCNANLLSALRGEGKAESTGDDYLRTMILTESAYQSAATGKAIEIPAG